MSAHADGVAAELWKAADACGFEEFKQLVLSALQTTGVTDEQRERLTLVANSLSKSTNGKDRSAAKGLRELLAVAPSIAVYGDVTDEQAEICEDHYLTVDDEGRIHGVKDLIRAVIVASRQFPGKEAEEAETYGFLRAADIAESMPLYTGVDVASHLRMLVSRAAPSNKGEVK
jgi:hypothetical protein